MSKSLRVYRASELDFAGAVRCSKIMWSANATADANASKKWIAVNRRMLHDVTVAALKIQLTIYSPSTGTTLNKFKITSAAQYDILPETTT